MSTLSHLEQFVSGLNAPRWRAIAQTAELHSGQHYTLWRDSTTQLSMIHRYIARDRYSWSYSLEVSEIITTVVIIAPSGLDGASDLYRRIQANVTRKPS
jgi:hypothetical protein